MKKKLYLITIISLISVFAFQSSIFAADLYANYQELSAANIQGTDYRITSRNSSSDLAIIAIHGGGIEPGTTELADYISGSSYSYYSFIGMKSSNNTTLHITSTSFDEPIALGLVQSKRRTLSIHGFSGSTKMTYVGGLDKIMVTNIKTSLKKAGFLVADAPPQFAAISTSNICNKNLNHVGVQIELSTGLRNSFFSSLTSDGRKTKTQEFYNYTKAINEAISLRTIEQPTSTAENQLAPKENTSSSSTTQQTNQTDSKSLNNDVTSKNTSVQKTISAADTEVKTDIVNKSSEQSSLEEDSNKTESTDGLQEITKYGAIGQENINFYSYKYINIIFSVWMMISWSPEIFQWIILGKKMAM